MTPLSHPELSSLPDQIPIFDVSGIVLLPRAHLPLAIEGDKFKKLVEDAFKQERWVGVVQKDPKNSKSPKIFRSGCLGKITTFTESEPGKYLIIISGIVRFTILKELRRKNGYRRAQISYDRFLLDLTEENPPVFERDLLMYFLKDYFHLYDISPNWDEINNASDERLLTSLAMICPFEPQEKQALLESLTLTDRCRMMTALMEMAFLKGSNEAWVKH